MGFVDTKFETLLHKRILTTGNALQHYLTVNLELMHISSLVLVAQKKEDNT